LSAVALASVLGARRCELYKDVDGIFTADPRVVPGARKIEALPWYAMSELAWAGAGVLHARGPPMCASRFGLTVEVRSSFKPQSRGTIVEPSTEADVLMASNNNGMEEAIVHAITCKQHMCFLDVGAGDGDQGEGDIQAALLDALWHHGEAPVFNQQSESSIRMLVTTKSAKMLEDELRAGRIAGQPVPPSSR
jgi:aspartate kinase